jgi:predicted adenine nucleotide alpha hydrolase (AANH) superfamily ATPase
LKFFQAIKADKSASSLTLRVYYYNPNIHPRAEYSARLKAMQQICSENKVEMIIPDWRPVEYFEKIGGDLEKPNRCIKCWNLRLEATAKYAKENNFEAFASTLVTSEYQDQNKIEKIALEKAKKYKIKFWQPKEVVKELKTSGFYKQFFCGCVYSMKERYEEKYKTPCIPLVPSRGSATADEGGQ